MTFTSYAQSRYLHILRQLSGWVIVFYGLLFAELSFCEPKLTLHNMPMTVLETNAITIPVGKTEVIALCYHDVRDNVDADLDKDPMALSTQHLLQQFEWLRTNGYQPISFDTLIAAYQHNKPLPPKPVLLTFDDGYASFYDKIYPLLRLYNYPAIYALVVDWLQVPENELVPYGQENLPRNRFLSWAQVREMQRSGLIEFASHTANLHKGILSNPQGNVQPSAVTRLYDNVTQDYENDEAYLARLTSDFKRSRDVIAKYTGVAPRIIVWPYGKHSKVAYEVAKSLGMKWSFVLGDRKNYPKNTFEINRHLIAKNPTLSEFYAIFAPSTVKSPVRVVHVDLDYIYDADASQQSRNLDMLLDRIKRMRINTVYLQAFADQDGDGNAESLYFPNKYLPMRADLFSRVAWQLKTRAEVNVYAWMPLTSFSVSPEKYRDWSVWDGEGGNAKPTEATYKRLSIFHPGAQQFIKNIYRDLAIHADFDGVLFHDDAYLSDYEDINPFALNFYKANGFPEFTLDVVRKDTKSLNRWAQLKTQALIDFSLELVDVVKQYRPEIKVARNMYARPILEPASEAWFAQNLQTFNRHYDYTAVMAMPYMEGAENSLEWLAKLMTVVSEQRELSKTVFEIQSKDWRTQTPIDAKEMVSQMKTLQRGGAIHFGYYPDDFIKNQPDLTEIRKGISLEDYPYKRR